MDEKKNYKWPAEKQERKKVHTCNSLTNFRGRILFFSANFLPVYDLAIHLMGHLIVCRDYSETYTRILYNLFFYTTGCKKTMLSCIL